MKLIKKIAAVLVVLMLLFSAVTPVFSVYADGAETDEAACPEGDGNVYTAPRYLAGSRPASLAGKTPLDMNAFIRALLEKAGKGYSQQSRYDVNYYDCSSLVQRCFRDLGITANVPASTYYWYELLENSPVGDTVMFYGTDTYVEYRLTAKNITIQGNESYFTKPGTIMVLIAPELCTGHICVSLGEFARQDGGLDPASDRNTIIQNTENYVASQLEARYGVAASLFTGPGAVTGIRSIWMYDKALGTDMTTKTGEQSGPYSPIWRVEAFNASRGVCVDNCTHGTNYTLNVRYVLEPIDSGEPGTTNAPPEITDITVSDVTPEGYRVTATFNAPAGVRQIQMPTWTEANGQDDLQWYSGIIQDEHTAYWDVRISDHNNESGNYITHVYVTDLIGRKVVAGINVTVPEPGPEESEEMGFLDAWVSDVTEDGFQVNAEFIAPYGVSEILMPAWTEANGQDDLKWHTASSADGRTVSQYIRTADHNNESGLYIIHIYVRDSKGHEIIAAVSADVPAKEAEQPDELAVTRVSVTEFSLGGGVRIGIQYTAPKGVKEILMPTWTEKNGQDDLVWHKAEIHEEYNMASMDIDISDHNNELGVYHTHIYLYDNTGAYVIEPVTYTITKEHTHISTKPVITDLVISDLSQNGYTVTATIMSVKPIKEVLMPTWTEAKGQDDLIWYETHAYEKSVGMYTASYRVRTEDHNNERGQYITHVYVTNSEGEQDVAATGVVVPGSDPVVYEHLAIADVQVTEVSSDGFRVSAYILADNKISEVLMPTWTEANGQDDLIWHRAEVDGPIASFYVRTADHNNEYGHYITHIYVKDTKGKEVAQAIDTMVPQPAAPEEPEELKILDIMILECDSDGYIVFTEFYAPNGVSEVLMPTWTEANGQDDLIWHRAEVNAVAPIYIANADTAVYYVETADHRNEYGKYITHVYVKDPTGKQVIAAIDVDVPKPGESVDPADPSGPVDPVTPAGVYVYNGLDYAPVFNPDYYLNKYPDLKQAFGNNASQAFSHFINNGINEGRTASPDFSVTVYRDRYADLRNAFGNNLQLYVQHYLTNGIYEGRSGK